jgi:hypothetical protein
MRVTYPAISLSGTQAAPVLQLMPKRRAAAEQVAHDHARRQGSGIRIPPGTDLRYSIESNGRGMTVKLVDRVSGDVLTTLEYRTPSLRDFELRARAGVLVDVSA